MAAKRLTRSRDDRMLFGVSGGLGKYFDIDPVLVRVTFVILALASGGLVLLGYLLLAIIVPEEPRVRRNPPATGANPEAGATTGTEVEVYDSSEPSNETGSSDNARRVLGILLVAVGAIILVGNLGFTFGLFRFDVLWPVAIIGIGLILLLSWNRGR